MKRYIKTTSVILFAAIALAGCSKTEEFRHNPDSALQIESVSGISPFALTTKAVITGDTLPGSDAATGIGIFVTATDGSAYDGHDKGYSNVNYANSGSGWSTSSPIYLSDTQGKLYGYFPYNSNAADLKAVPVASSLNGTDYLYAEPQTVSHSNKNVSIQMNHALSRLHLTIKKGANFTANAPLSEIILTSKAIDATGTMDITTGAISVSKKSNETGIVELATDGTITSEGIVKDILLIPADGSEGKKDITIVLTIDGKMASVSLSGDNGIDIRQGIQNNVTLTVEDTGIKVTGVGIGVWDEQGSQQVKVGKCTVIVKLAEEQFPEVGNDVLISPIKLEQGKILVEAYSKSQKRLECYLDGEVSSNNYTKSIYKYLDSSFEQKNLFSHIFTIFNIKSDVTATIGYPRPESISLTSSNHTLYIGGAAFPGEGSFNLSVTVSPEDTYNKKCTWSSSDPSVATVDKNGLVSAKAAGTTDITVTTEVGGITAKCTVIVESYEKYILSDEDILSGEFSVGPEDNNKKIHFTRGNLRYTPASRLWHFFDKQYELSHNSTELSLFTWGYGRWSIDFGTSTYQEGYDFTDWSEGIASGDIILRTLSANEWTHLLNSRDGNRFAKAKVHDTRGLLIFPDGYSLPSGYTSSDGGKGMAKVNDATVDYPSENIPDDGDNKTWSEMEAAGVVFLPTAGYRMGSDVYRAGVSGFYWSSTACDSNYAYLVIIGSNDVYYDRRSFGYSVRLITECQ